MNSRGRGVKRNGDIEYYCEAIWKGQVSRRDTRQNAVFDQSHSRSGTQLRSVHLFRRSVLTQLTTTSSQNPSKHSSTFSTVPQCPSSGFINSNSEKWHHFPTHHLKGHKEQTGRQAIFHSRCLCSLFALYISSLLFTE